MCLLGGALRIDFPSKCTDHRGRIDWANTAYSRHTGLHTEFPIGYTIATNGQSKKCSSLNPGWGVGAHALTPPSAQNIPGYFSVLVYLNQNSLLLICFKIYSELVHTCLGGTHEMG